MDVFTLWNTDVEREFFVRTLEIAVPDQLFYVTDDGRYVAYWERGYKGRKTTLQSRNAFVGSFTEKWTKSLLEPIAKGMNLFVVQGVVCEEIGLSKKSPADVAICKTDNRFQRAENILMIVEVKMSIVWNWEYNPRTGTLWCIGDYTTHQGNPSLLRSDTMLKAIGKAINIRVSNLKSAKIPIIVLGNTPITRSYYDKVDQLRKNGILQGFYSVNPQPLDDPTHQDNIKATQYKGFFRFDTYEELKQEIIRLLTDDSEFFSGMKTKRELGKLIDIASRQPTYEQKAETFLKLLRNEG
ncbi:MAG: hypothetical protein GXO48_09430 [Chlorobi bacterium]|nr:hypothetical protein [Chlorobiota bacterium]